MLTVAAPSLYSATSSLLLDIYEIQVDKEDLKDTFLIFLIYNKLASSHNPKWDVSPKLQLDRHLSLLGVSTCGTVHQLNSKGIIDDFKLKVKEACM